MKRTSKGASAPKFIAISDLPGCTVYTGAREQLIALGFARPDQFPEGKKRLKCDYSMDNQLEEGWASRKIKGGLFQLTKAMRYAFPSLQLGSRHFFSSRPRGGVWIFMDDKGEHLFINW